MPTSGYGRVASTEAMGLPWISPNSSEKRFTSPISSCCSGNRSTPYQPRAWRMRPRSGSGIGCARSIPRTVAPSTAPVGSILIIRLSFLVLLGRRLRPALNQVHRALSAGRRSVRGGYIVRRGRLPAIGVHDVSLACRPEQLLPVERQDPAVFHGHARRLGQQGVALALIELRGSLL